MSGSQPQLKLFGEEPARGNDQLLLGTSSWTGEGWVGSFYPVGSKPADFLSFYSEKFRTVEVDSTFYRIPTANTVKQWRERMPEGFTFAAKVPQSITHQKVLVDAEGDLKEFLSVMDLLGDRLGPLLLQFPYMNKTVFRGVGFFLERLKPFLADLPKGYKWAVEIRNKNWLSEKFYSVLREHGVRWQLWTTCGCRDRMKTLMPAIPSRQTSPISARLGTARVWFCQMKVHFDTMDSPLPGGGAEQNALCGENKAARPTTIFSVNDAG